jgi:hypothetical protein
MLPLDFAIYLSNSTQFKNIAGVFKKKSIVTGASQIGLATRLLHEL